MIKKIFEFFTHTEEFVSVPVKEARKIFEKYSIKDYIRPIYEDDGIYYCNDGYYSLIVECAPKIRMGKKTSETIEEILEKLPKDVFLQIQLFGSQNIEKFLEIYQNDRKKEFNQNIEYVIERIIKNLREKSKKSINDIMATTIKNHRLFFSIKTKKLKELANFKNTFLNILTANAFYPAVLKPNDLLPIYWEILNPYYDFGNIPKYNSFIPLNKQTVSSKTVVKVDDKYIKIGEIKDKKIVGKTWLALSPVTFPEYAHISDFGIKLGDYISNAVNDNQFFDSFIVSLNIKKLSKSINKEILKKTKFTVNIRAKHDDTRLQEKQSEAYSMIKRLKDFEPLFLMDLIVLVSGKDESEAVKNADNVKTFWNKGGETSSIYLENCDGVHLPMFLANIPLGINEDYFQNIEPKSPTFFADQVSCFIPAEADYKGNYPTLFFISRRGQIAGFDFFKSNYAKNFFVVAESGAGKSVLLNYIALNYRTKGDRVFIMDIGGSYEELCKEFEGEYIEIDIDRPLSLNPFSTIDELTKEDLNFFADFLYLLGASKNLSEALKHEKLIKSELQNVISDLFALKKQKLEITDIRDKFYRMDDKRFVDFAKHLTMYCRGELFGDFFSGEADIRLQNDFCVLELGKVENYAEIRDPIIFIWQFHKSNAVYKQENLDRGILDLIDELHKFLGKNPLMDDAIDQAYRRYRKHRASIGTATQNFLDVNDEEGNLTKAGNAIISNSPWKIFLSQQETSINALLNSNSFNFDRVEEELLRQIETKKGYYSEMLLITPEGFKLPYRLVFDKFFYYLTTTDKDDKALIKKYMNMFNLSKKEAILKIIEDGR